MFLKNESRWHPVQSGEIGSRNEQKGLSMETGEVTNRTQKQMTRYLIKLEEKSSANCGK